jgi:GDP-L-fucose synthase
VKALLRRTDVVKVRATLHRGAPTVPADRVEYVRADLCTAEGCRLLLQGADCAIMAAANTAGAMGSTKRPWEQVTPNLVMYATFLQEASRTSLARLVMVGSASLYQPFDGFIREDQLDLNQDPPDAHYGIGWVTRCTEKLCRFWHTHSTVKMALVRAGNVYGPCARFDPQTSNFIPAIVRKAVDRMDPFEVWGSPRVARDVIYVDDFAGAIMALLDFEGLTFDVFNISSGVATTVGEVVDSALKWAGHSPQSVRYGTDGPTTVSFRGLDCAKAREVLSWTPAYPMTEGIKATVEWWKENKESWTR